MQCVLMCVIKVRNLWLTFLSTSLLPADFTADDTAADAVFGFGWGVNSNGAADGGQGLGGPAAVPLGACTTWGEGSSLQLLPTVLVPHQKVSQLEVGGIFFLLVVAVCSWIPQVVFVMPGLIHLVIQQTKRSSVSWPGLIHLFIQQTNRSSVSWPLCTTCSGCPGWRSVDQVISNSILRSSQQEISFTLIFYSFFFFYFFYNKFYAK